MASGWHRWHQIEQLPGSVWISYILVVILLLGGWHCCSSVRTVPVDEDEDDAEEHQDVADADEPLEMVESMRVFDVDVDVDMPFAAGLANSLWDAWRWNCGIRLGVAPVTAAHVVAAAAAAAAGVVVVAGFDTSTLRQFGATGVSDDVCSRRGISDVLEADFVGCAYKSPLGAVQLLGDPSGELGKPGIELTLALAAIA